MHTVIYLNYETDNEAANIFLYFEGLYWIIIDEFKMYIGIQWS